MNRRIVLASRPKGPPTPQNFRLEEVPIPSAPDGGFTVRNHWLSLDPYMRGRMDAAKSYAKSVEIGEVMEGGTVGEVIESRSRWLRRTQRVVQDLRALYAACQAAGLPGAALASVQRSE